MSLILPIVLGGYMTLNGVALAQTMHCVGAGVCREANPAMRVFVDHPATFGAVKMGLGSGAVAGIWALRKDRPKFAWVLAAVAVAVESADVLHNARAKR